MFAAPTNASKPKIVRHSVPKLAANVSQPMARQPRLGIAEQMVSPRRANKNQSGFRLRSQEAERGWTAEPEAAPRVSWDFNRIRVFPPDREGRKTASCLSLQAKLAFGRMEDPLEYEADRIAEKVVRAPNPGFSVGSAPPQISRKCNACEAKQPLPPAKMIDWRASPASELPSIVDEVLHTPGQPLDAASRTYFEPRFQHDFSRVRVHSDARAVESARAMNALAYTVGRHIVFGSGQYMPGMTSSQRLLAHELTHVVQQTNLPVRVSTASASLRNSSSSAENDSGAFTTVSPASNAQRSADTVSSTLNVLQRKDDKVPAKEPSKSASDCPQGFTLIKGATWLRCEETSGTRNSGCSFCKDGEQEGRCEEILKLLGHHNVIAPKAGTCGSKFKITTPHPGAPVIDVVKAEIPGGTELDINQGVITDLGLDVQAGRYDVCLKGPDGKDDRLVISGGSACQKPKRQPEKPNPKKS